MEGSIKKYADYSVKSAAAIILSDIALSGKSTGWCGSLEALGELKNFLKPFNVEYVCDFRGTWENRHK